MGRQQPRNALDHIAAMPPFSLWAGMTIDQTGTGGDYISPCGDLPLRLYSFAFTVAQCQNFR